MSSIVTNVNAMSALQTLRTISNNMEDTQSRISSGLRVSSASDNAAYWSIATTMKSDNASLSSVQDAIGIGAAKVDTAYAGMETGLEVLDKIKDKLLSAQESAGDKGKIQEEIKQLQEQLKSIASSASFSGENFLQGDLSKGDISKSVVGSFVRDADGNVKVQKIDIKLNASNVLFDTNKTEGAAKQGLLDSTLKIDEKRAYVEITTAKPVTATSDDLAKGGATLKTAQVGAAGANLDYYRTAGGDNYIRSNTEKFDANGASKGFSPDLDANGKELWVKVKWVDDDAAVTPVPDAPNNQTAKAVGATAVAVATTGDATVNADFGYAAGTPGKFYIQTAAVVTKVSVAATTEAGLKGVHSTFGEATNPLKVGTLTGQTFTGVTNEADKATINTAGFTKTVVGTDGVATVYSDFKESTTVPGTFAAGKTETFIKLGTDDTWVKADVAANTKADEAGQQAYDVSGTKYYIDTKNTTAPGKVETDAGFSVTDLNITKLGDVSKKLGVSEGDALDMMVQFVADQYKSMTSAAAELGSVSMRIGLQEDFVSKLSDTLEKGVGRLVDADMNEESTRLKALQTQQQLAVQALSIANSDSQNILSLFR